MDELCIEKLSALSVLLLIAVTMWRIPITCQFFGKEEYEKLHQNLHRNRKNYKKEGGNHLDQNIFLSKMRRKLQMWNLSWRLQCVSCQNSRKENSLCWSPENTISVLERGNRSEIWGRRWGQTLAVQRDLQTWEVCSGWLARGSQVLLLLVHS